MKILDIVESRGHKIIAAKLADIERRKEPQDGNSPAQQRAEAEQEKKQKSTEKGVAEAQARLMPKTDLRVGDHVVADTSKEQYPGGDKSRSGVVTRIGQTGVHIAPDGGGEREYHPYKIVKKSSRSD